MHGSYVINDSAVTNKFRCKKWLILMICLARIAVALIFTVDYCTDEFKSQKQVSDWIGFFFLQLLILKFNSLPIRLQCD